MLPKPQRLRHARDFSKLSTQGRPVFGPLFTLRVRQIKGKEKLVAFITSTKAMKLAVDRNRAKRRMRAIIRSVWAEIPESLHLLFILKPEVAAAEHESLVTEVRRVLTKIPEALTKPPKLSPGALKLQAKRKAKAGMGGKKA